MAKPPRSPLLGYNHNLTHLGQVFHIQTEDSGPISPRLFTHLFFEGTILVSRKHEYDAALPDDKVRALMQLQHKTVMKDLLRARLDGVVVPFFAARGIEIVVPVQGAVPATAHPETPGPVMVLPQNGGDGHRPVSEPIPHAPPDYQEPFEQAPLEQAPFVPSPADATEGDSPAGRPRRTNTRPIETNVQRGASASPVVVRAADGRRSPFVRSGGAPASRMASTDGVVVQRNVIVGGTSTAPSRQARIRPPVPYVVTGGGHTERPPRAAAGTAPGAPTSAAGSPAGAPSAQTVAAAGLGSDAVPRTGGFGVGLPEDKSLDEVILEYLSEDPEG